MQTARDFLALLQRELDITPPDEYPLFHAGTEASQESTLGITERSEPSAWIDQYFPVMDHPLPGRAVEILDDDGHVWWSADLEEKADDTDKEAGMYKDAVPAFHGLSVSGNATGKVVYAHYGRQEDYQELVAKGVDLEGAIVLTRYGGVFRGLKVKGAEELGAAAVLTYSDPRDDGTVTEDNGYLPYPDGPARNPTSLQRGSVLNALYPGDPTTPGYPAYENATRVNGTSYPSIPSLPISWSNAKVLLDEIAESGRKRQVRVINKVLHEVMPIWNVMGVIPGHIKDEVVVIGNHRDGRGNTLIPLSLQADFR
jgi:N-acetylated-alpha-linked acidic dipeptidase